MLGGIVTGVVIGILVIIYFSLEPWLDRFCVMAATVLVFQLLGSTIGATAGKPHEPD